jgi:hypothetical protein
VGGVVRGRRPVPRRAGGGAGGAVRGGRVRGHHGGDRRGGRAAAGERAVQRHGLRRARLPRVHGPRLIQPLRAALLDRRPNEASTRNCNRAALVVSLIDKHLSTQCNSSWGFRIN